MRFGPWQPIDDAERAAPAEPGVLQVRAEGLLPFPRGKNTMLLYAASGDQQTLAAFVAGNGRGPLETARQRGARYIRFGASAQPQTDLARLLAQFEERFGALPGAHRSE